jgi:plasmid stability protein
MKTTIDLPVEVVRGLKLHTVRHGRKLKETALEILQAGLFRCGQARSVKPAHATRHRVKLPLVKCRHPAAPKRELTADKVAEVLLKQEVDWLA